MKSSWIPSAPITINWAVTNRCNFRCSHCYSRNDPADELRLEVLKGFIDKLAEAKIFSVNFGGGEPLLRTDIFEISRYTTAHGMIVSMNSNGYLISKTVAKKLKTAGFRKVGISIDSPRPEVHDTFRGTKGSHERALRALRNLKDAGLKTSISSVICKINVADVDGLIAQAHSLEVDNINFHNFKCSGLGYANKDTLDLSPGEWRDFYVRASERKKKLKKLDLSLEDPIIASLGIKAEGLVKGSVCGKLSLNIKANGDITPCGFIPIVIGNLRTDSLPDIWSGSPVLQKLRNKRPRGKCRTCGHYEDCLGGCSARALALTGNMNNPDPHCWESEPG